jgi:hypothetical protein
MTTDAATNSTKEQTWTAALITRCLISLSRGVYIAFSSKEVRLFYEPAGAVIACSFWVQIRTPTVQGAAH